MTKALHWKNSNGDRVLAFDMTIPLVGKNVDICLFDSNIVGKVEQLEAYYKSIKKEERFKYIKSIIEDNAVLNEVTNALKQREEHGDLNNDGIIRMVQGYFTELAFVYAEIYRVCAPGATIAFVNDNVRYGGEVIPVDFLSSLLAEQFGFIVEKIYCLRQRKGNSSQQMAKFGKVSLRKSITIWKKECPHNKC